MNKLIFKVLLLSTKGCDSCVTVRNIIKEAISKHSKTIVYEEKDFADIDKKSIKNKIKDFPTIFFMIDNTMVFSRVGTAPVACFLRWFDLHFK